MTPRPSGIPSRSEPSSDCSKERSSAARTPPSVPDHELIKQIGRGSYGEVWLGRNATGSYRAVKLIYRASFEEDKPYEREFNGIREFEPISRSHPAQIDILHVGRNDEAGYYYYVMQLADDDSAEHTADTIEPHATKAAERRSSHESTEPSSGAPGAPQVQPDIYIPKTLQRVLEKRGRLPVELCVEIAYSLVQALDNLHAHGLVHRDIKPSNVVFVHGRPKLADIGLVTRADLTSSFVGTEGYVPPEGPGRPQADLYSLGKVCYEMATGMSRNAFPEPPLGIEESDDHRAFLEFNEIIAKSCETFDRRYKNAAELAADLRLLLAGRSVRSKHARRRSLVVARRVILALASAGILAFLAINALHPAPFETTAFSHPTRVPLSFDEAELGAHLYGPRRFDISPDGQRILYVENVPSGKLYLYENDFVRPLFEELSRDWAFLAVAWHPDGGSFAVSGYKRKTLTADKHVRELNQTIFVCDLANNQWRIVPVSFTGYVHALLWRPSESGFTVHVSNQQSPGETFTLDMDGTVRHWEVGALDSLITPASRYSPNGKWLSGGDRNDVWLIKADGSDAIRVTTHPFAETHPAWLDDETLLYVRYDSPSPNQKARLMRLRIDPETGRPLSEPDPIFPSRWSQILHPRVVSDKKKLLFVERESINWIEVCSYPEETEIRRIGRGDSPKLSPDGSQIYYIDRTAGQEGIYARPTKPRGMARRVVDAVGISDNGFDISPDSNRLVYARSIDLHQNIVEITRIKDGSVTRLKSTSNEDLITNHYFGPIWSPLGKHIGVVTGPREISLVDADTGRVTKEIQLAGEIHPTAPPCWSPSGESVAFVIMSDEYHHLEVYRPEDDIGKRLASEPEKLQIEQLSWRPGSNRGELTYFTYDYPDCHRSVFLSGEPMEYLLPVRPPTMESAPGEMDFWGTWAPCGKRFYFVSESHSTGQMHLFHAETGEVDHEAVPDSLPFWSRDASTMAWSDSEVRISLQVMEIK